MAEGRLGTVRISPHVLATIARLTALSVPGIVRMYRGDSPSGFDSWLTKHGGRDGVQVHVEDGAVSVDLYVVAESTINLYDLGMKTQSQVSRAIQEMVGMPVLAVNVHVQDVRRQEAVAITEA